MANNNEIKLLAVGDISLKGVSLKDPFDDIRDTLKRNDILFGNLETVLSVRGNPEEKSVILSVSPDRAHFLCDAGFDVLNAANNHIMDRGLKGFADTLDFAAMNGLKIIGVKKDRRLQSHVIIKKNGTKVGFLAYYEYGFENSKNNIFINKLSRGKIISDVQQLKPKCDNIVISLHWGIEKASYPSPDQISIAHELIDKGATIILGHHPHVIQGIERYNCGLIAYSLGNFQFEFDPAEFTRHINPPNYSMILSVKLGKNGLRSYEAIPIEINLNWSPTIASEPVRTNILGSIDELSRSISGGKTSWQQWYAEIAPSYISDAMRSWKIRIQQYGVRHIISFFKWLCNPFTIKCLTAILRKRLNTKSKNCEPGKSQQSTQLNAANHVR